jgi:hypothetical protein
VIHAPKFSPISESGEEQRLAAEGQWGHWPDSHEWKFLQVSTGETLGIAKRLVQLKSTLVTTSEVPKSIQLSAHRQTESKTKYSQLLKNLVVDTA